MIVLAIAALALASCSATPSGTKLTGSDGNKMQAHVTVQVEAVKDELVARLTIENRSDAVPLYVEKRKALQSSNPRIKLFEITADGKDVPYIGVMEKRRPPEKGDFISIPPKGHVTGTANLIPLYRFLPGVHEYRINYRAFHGDPDNVQVLNELSSEAQVFRY
jgi:hypothetical protein